MIFGHSTKKILHRAEKGVRIQSPLYRKPLSPVSSTVLSKANIKNSQEPRKMQNVATKPILQESEELIGTPPSKLFIAGDEDNVSPENMGLSVPTTPLTVSMLNISTPETLISKAAAKIAQPFDYSFEELRAGFVIHLDSCSMTQ